MYDELFTCPKCGQRGGEGTIHGKLTLCDACWSTIGMQWESSQQVDFRAIIATGLKEDERRMNNVTN